MFNCYVHGWSSHVYTCPACTNFITSSSSSVPDYFVGISGHELSKLKEENKKMREALKKIASDKPVHDGFTSKAQTEIAREALEGK